MTFTLDQWISFVPMLVVLFVFALAMTVGAIGLFKGMYYLGSLPAYKRPEVAWESLPWTRFNHMNIILTPRHLTPEGQERFLKGFKGIGLFLLCLALVMIAAHVAGVPTTAHAL